MGLIPWSSAAIEAISRLGRNFIHLLRIGFISGKKIFIPGQRCGGYYSGSFVNLFKALKQYDPGRPIETYILEIARRVRIGRYRKASAVKRAGNPVPVDFWGSDSERGFIAVASADENQEDSLIRAQEKGLLKKP